MTPIERQEELAARIVTMIRPILSPDQCSPFDLSRAMLLVVTWINIELMHSMKDGIDDEKLTADIHEAIVSQTSIRLADIASKYGMVVHIHDSSTDEITRTMKPGEMYESAVAGTSQQP